ncbi:DUF2254 domain-containing protein [soil metagenome]
MSLGAIVLSAVCLQFDNQLSLKGAEKVSWLWAGGTEGARAILSTIASSMITVAGVVFSITIVSLTLASSQFGPRLLRNFVRDAINQAVLGTFVATYLYCLLVLREVKNVNDQSFVPYLSVTVALVLTTASLGMLIFFIHHVAGSIQAENMVASVAAELRAAMESLFPEQAGKGKPAGSEAAEDEKQFGEGEPCRVVAKNGGYVQAIEVEKLMQCAKEHNVVIRLLKKPGEFVLSGGLLAEIVPVNDDVKELIPFVFEAHIIERLRTPRQDAEYCLNQLVEVAVRALSPGINDPFTAIACIHWLGDGLCVAAGREMPESRRFDEDAKLRIVAKVPTFAGLADAAFNAIRQYGASSPAVVICLLETLTELAPHLVRDEDRATIRLHAEMTSRDGLKAMPDAHDAQEIEGRLRQAREALAR